MAQGSEPAPVDARPHPDSGGNGVADGMARGCVLAIDFGGSKIAVAVHRSTGQAAAGAEAEIQGVVDTSPELGAEANLVLGVELAKELLSGAPVSAVGAATFGIPADDGVALSPAIEGWDKLPLRRRLADAFGAPVVVDTDVKAAATAELRHGALVGADPAIYLNLGTGLAVAIAANGAVVRGANRAAGEVGYCLLRNSPRGDAGVLEDVVSGMGLARAVAAAAPSSSGRTGADSGVVAALFAAGSDGSGSSVERILAAFLDELCFHMVNLTVALDPQRIAVGGGLVRSWERIEGPLRAALERHVPFPPELVTGAYPFDAALRGAMDLGLELALAGRGHVAPGAPGVAPAAGAPAQRPDGSGRGNGSDAGGRGSGSGAGDVDGGIKSGNNVMASKGGRQC